MHDQQEGLDDSWDAIWNSAGRITAGGYVVEAAIPFKSLRFPNIDAKHTWGIYAERWWPRNERVQMLSMKWNRSNGCQLCQANLLTGLSDISPGRNLEFAPTFTSRRMDTRDDLFSGHLESGNVDGDIGVNARWGVTTDLTLNATYNPDFSQVEAGQSRLPEY